LWSCVYRTKKSAWHITKHGHTTPQTQFLFTRSALVFWGRPKILNSTRLLSGVDIGRRPRLCNPKPAQLPGIRECPDSWQLAAGFGQADMGLLNPSVSISISKTSCGRITTAPMLFVPGVFLNFFVRGQWQLSDTKNSPGVPFSVPFMFSIKGMKRRQIYREFIGTLMPSPATRARCTGKPLVHCRARRDGIARVQELSGLRIVVVVRCAGVVH